jgi:phospholipid/cholesterol/gamma-HCH transport system ATP-binding protein
MSDHEGIAEGENAIEITGVDKRFGDKRVYEDMSLTVRAGETLTVVGPSGTGKSVLLKLIIGLLKPDAGVIRVCGIDVAPLDEAGLRPVRKKVGMLFQGSALFDSMSVGDNVAYGVREHFDWAPKKVRDRVAECLEWVGLPGTERMWPADLSGGMKKRVGLARAIAPGPEVILYDEPTTGLDPANTMRINELIVAMQRRLRATSVVITHDLDSALAVSNRIGLLTGRRIPYVVDSEQARRAPPPELRAFMSGEMSGDLPGDLLGDEPSGGEKDMHP